MRTGIKSSDISVVVQGAIDKENTTKCLRSIRKYLPDAEIILSTWEGSDIEGFDYDKVILNKDPGGADCSRDGRGINNCNREIVSTFEGIKKVERQYCLKIRSDIILLNSNILKIKFRNLKRNDKYKFLTDRILVCSVYSRVYAIHNVTGEKTLILFHPSDWLYLGLSKDLYALFDIPLTNEPEFSQWFKDRPQIRNGYTDVHPFRLWKFSPEAYIWVEYLRKNYNINIEDKLDITPENIELSRYSLVNNFYMADQCQLGIKLAKYNIVQPRMEKRDRDGLYTNIYWQKEYKKCCDKKYIIKPTVCNILNLLVDFFKIRRKGR